MPACTLTTTSPASAPVMVKPSSGQTRDVGTGAADPLTLLGGGPPRARQQLASLSAAEDHRVKPLRKRHVPYPRAGCAWVHPKQAHLLRDGFCSLALIPMLLRQISPADWASDGNAKARAPLVPMAVPWAPDLTGCLEPRKLRYPRPSGYRAAAGPCKTVPHSRGQARAAASFFHHALDVFHIAGADRAGRDLDDGCCWIGLGTG